MSTKGSSKVAVGLQEMGRPVIEEEQWQLQEQLAVEVHFRDPRALLCPSDWVGRQPASAGAIHLRG